VRVAAFQREPLFDDIPVIVERLKADLEWCDRQDVKLALFPECYLQGYVLDREILSLRALALEESGFRSLLEGLASARATCVLGLVERRGAAVFNAAAVIRNGTVLGTYRKARLHRKETAFDPGEDRSLFEVDGWPFGISICYEANFPEIAASVARQGARLICYPLNNMLVPDVADQWRAKSVDNLRRRAIETGCWVVSSDVVGEHEGMLCHGCTCIVSPAGELVSRVDEGSAGVAMFDLCT